MAQKRKSNRIKSQPLICVRDVEKSSRWYQRLLGCQSAHGGDEYEMLMSENDLILQLHAWDVHEHPYLGDPKNRSRGNGMVLWFHVSDFDALVARVKKLKAKVLESAHENELAGHREIWLADLDGYVVVIAGA